MSAVAWVIVVGIVMGLLPLRRAGRPVPRTVAVALVGAFAGALVGGLAGTILAAVSPLPWIGVGIVLGPITGAVIGLHADQRLDVTVDFP